jgi:hypothetical protein
MSVLELLPIMMAVGSKKLRKPWRFRVRLTELPVVT